MRWLGGEKLSQHLISSKSDLVPSSSDPILSWDRTKRLTGVGGSGGVELVACAELLKAFLFDLSEDTKVRLSKFIHYARTTTKETSAALCGSRSQNL